MSLATALLWATEEGGEVAEEHGSEPTWLTVVLGIVAVAIALYLLYVFVTTPAPAGHHDEHGHDDHGHDAHGHDEAAAPVH